METSPFMALVAALAGTPLAPLAVYAPLIVALSAILAAVLPTPPAGSRWVPARRLLDLLAFNFGAARNAPAPRPAASVTSQGEKS